MADRTKPTARTIKAKVERRQVEMDPPLDIFNVVLTGADGLWTESFGSEETLRTFLRGVQAGGTLGGWLESVDIPRHPTDKYVSAFTSANEA